MEGGRKLLAAVVFGLLALAALVVIILLGKFSDATFTAWMSGTAGVFGIYMGANVVSKFSPVAKTCALTDAATAAAEDEAAVIEAAAPAAPVTTAPKDPKEKGGTGLLGLSARLKAKREARKKKEGER
jgi:hypothetical protein